MTDAIKTEQKTIGDRIKDRRDELGLTQGDLVALTESIAKEKGLDKGVSQQVISKLERNLSRSTKDAPLLSEALQVDLLYLVSGDKGREDFLSKIAPAYQQEAQLSAFDHVYALSSDSKKQLLTEVKDAIENNAISDEQAQTLTNLIQSMNQKSQSGRFKKKT